MAGREKDKRLVEIWENGGHTYSISKLNTINQCKYQAYLTYKAKVQQTNNCWAILGGTIHDRIEECVKDGANESCIKNAINEEIENLSMLNLDFPKDRNGGTSIRDNWIKNMTKFSENFKTPRGKFITEQLVLLPIREGIWMMGYIDAIRINEDGSLYIIDWKTSSNFDKKHLLEAGRQLIVYAMAKEHEGFTVKKVSWCMLKYCVTSWQLKNGKTREKVSEWRNLVKDLRKQLEKSLDEFGYDEIEIDCYMREALLNNSLENMPDEIKQKYKTRIYVRDYEITPELREECMQYIENTIDTFESLGDEEDNWEPCDIKKDSFFCASLCGHSKHCKYFAKYLDTLRLEPADEDDEDLFG